MAAVKRRPAEEDNFEEPKVPATPISMEKQILAALGTPPNLYKVQVANVGEQRWRVNIRVYAESTESNNTVQVSKVAHSYYLKTDERGKITNLEVIEKVY
jgi:hypothetical protein